MTEVFEILSPWCYCIGLPTWEERNTFTIFYVCINRKSAYEVFETFETNFERIRYMINRIYISPPEPICKKEVFVNCRGITIGLYRIKFFYNRQLGEAFRAVFDDMFNNAIIPFRLKWKLFMRNVFTAKLMERMFHPNNILKFPDWGFGFDN